MTEKTQDFIHPEIEKFCDDLKKTINPEKFLKQTPEKKIEEVLIQADFILQPSGDYVLLDSNLTLKQILTD